MGSGWKGLRPMGRVSSRAIVAQAMVAAMAVTMPVTMAVKMVAAIVAAMVVAGLPGAPAHGATVRPCAHSGAAAVEGSDVDPRARLDRLAESLAQCAFDALVSAAWSDGVSPTAVMPPGLAEEIDRATAIALLSRPQPERADGAWDALRIGSARPAAPPATDVAPSAKPRAPLVYPVTDLDLERACQLLAREALLANLPPDERLPADLVRDLLVHAPLPPTNPAADPSLARRVQKLERAGKLSRGQRLEAERVVSEFEAARDAASAWKSRYDAFLAGLALRADGEEGRALVAIARRTHAARTGWSPRDGASEPARPVRGGDEVVRSVRKALAEGHACYALSEVLVALEPIRVARIDSLAISGEGRLRVGRSESVVSRDAIDAWRRACGLERSAVGWTGLPARPRPRLPKIRDAPFGIKPL